jgi:hypothetical protein
MFEDQNDVSIDITPQIIAMGFPSESVEATYRNPMKDVLRYSCCAAIPVYVVDVWWMCGGCVVDVWWMCGGCVVDVWWMCGGCVVGFLWLVLWLTLWLALWLCGCVVGCVRCLARMVVLWGSQILTYDSDF